jgi:3-oxoacyl-[acyl-carrier protein] reductase
MKAALVTGAGSDIGREVSLFLASKGYEILAHELKAGCVEIENSIRAFNSASIRYRTLFADFSVEDEVVKMCDDILKTGLELGVIVHIAGGSTAFGAYDITPKSIVSTVFINLISPMIITHKLLPALAEGSLVVSTSAMCGFHAGWYPTDACFDAAKGGLLRFTENMARSLGPKTRVNAIVLGLSYVDDNYKDWRQGRAYQFPMKRIAYPQDYVKCVEFFLNHDYITGVSLPLDGGWYSYNVNPPFSSALMQKA